MFEVIILTLAERHKAHQTNMCTT